MKKNNDKQINWLSFLVIFILGILIATNLFAFVYISNISNQIVDLNKEINKLKSDDIALAQTINNLYSQLESLGIINK